MLVTRCPHCETAFRIQAAHLEQAEGHVRCGRCANVFDAYQELRQSLSPTLSDLAESNADQPDDPALLSTEEVDQLDQALQGEEIDVAAVSAAVGPSAAPTVTEEETEDDTEPDAPTEPAESPKERLEFNLPEDQWDDFFSDTVVGDDEVPDISDTGVEWVVLGEVGEIAADSDTDTGSDADSEGQGNDNDSAAATDGAETSLPDGHVMDLTSNAQVPDEEEAAPAETPPSDDAVESSPQEALFADLEEVAATDARPPNYWQSAAAVLLVIGLCGQYVHYNRQTLATHATIGPRLVASYERLGVELSPAWDLSQYQINRWVAASDTSDEGNASLKITAEIANRGPKPQPFPLVQLALKDRWDETVAGRVFEPAEYLAQPVARNLLGAGEHVQAQLRVLDPGQDAYGFELDVCIRAKGEQLRCANEPKRR